MVEAEEAEEEQEGGIRLAFVSSQVSWRGDTYRERIPGSAQMLNISSQDTYRPLLGYVSVSSRHVYSNPCILLPSTHKKHPALNQEPTLPLPPLSCPIPPLLLLHFLLPPYRGRERQLLVWIELSYTGIK